MERKKLKENRKGKRSDFRPFLIFHMCGSHVCQTRPMKRGRKAVSKQRKTRDTRPEMKKFHISREQEKTVSRVNRLLMKTSSLWTVDKSAYSKVYRMATHDKEQSLKQRYQANARERDRTHRWRANCVCSFTFLLSYLRRKTHRNTIVYDTKTKIVFI